MSIGITSEDISVEKKKGKWGQEHFLACLYFCNRHFICSDMKIYLKYSFVRLFGCTVWLEGLSSLTRYWAWSQQWKHQVWTTGGCCCSVSKSCSTLWDPMDCSGSCSSVVHYLQSLLKFISIESVKLSSHLLLCHSLPFWPSIFPSIRTFSNELPLFIKCPK